MEGRHQGPWPRAAKTLAPPLHAGSCASAGRHIAVGLLECGGGGCAVVINCFADFLRVQRRITRYSACGWRFVVKWRKFGGRFCYDFCLISLRMRKHAAFRVSNQNKTLPTVRAGLSFPEVVYFTEFSRSWKNTDRIHCVTFIV